MALDKPKSEMNDLEKAVVEALNKMYKEAEPSLDFDYALENPEEFDDDWYSNHKLSRERQEEIREKVKDKYNLNEREERAFNFETVLNYSPTYP